MKPKQPDNTDRTTERLKATYRYLLKKEEDSSGAGANLNSKIRDTVVSAQIRDEMTANLKYTALLGLSIGKLSEASIHIQQNQYLVTRRDCSFNNLEEDDLLLASPGSTLNEVGNPRYWSWHQAIYQSNSDVKAILLGQPPDAMALAHKSKLPKKELLENAADAVGHIALCSPEIEDITSAVENATVILIPGIGVLSCAEVLLQAVENLALVNQWCKISTLTDS